MSNIGAHSPRDSGSRDHGPGAHKSGAHRSRIPRSGVHEAALTYRHAASGDGCAQCHPGLVLRRRPLPRCRAPVAHGLEMARQGADVVDVGGESSRPGAEPVSEREELRQVVPVIEALSPTCGCRSTPQAGGGRSGGGCRCDARSTTSRRRCGLWRRNRGWGGSPCTCRTSRARCKRIRAYDDVVAEVRAFVCSRGRGPRWRTACAKCGWTPASASARRRRTIWPCCTVSPSSWARDSPCSWARAASFLGRLAPLATGEPSGVDDRHAGSIATAVWAMLSRPRRWCGSTMSGPRWRRRRSSGPPVCPPRGHARRSGQDRPVRVPAMIWSDQGRRPRVR